MHNTLGYGFLKKVYRNALFYELMAAGIKAEMEKRILVRYFDHAVGDYSSDLIVEDVVLCELEAAESLSPADESQLINYLSATNIEVGLLLNFGKTPQIRRKVFDNDRKYWRTTNITRWPDSDDPPEAD